MANEKRLPLNTEECMELYRELRKGGSQDSKNSLSKSPLVEALNVFGGILGKIAQKSTPEGWMEFLKSKEVPPIELSTKEMEVLKGGFFNSNLSFEWQDRGPKGKLGVQIIQGDPGVGFEKKKVGSASIGGREYETRTTATVWQIGSKKETKAVSYSPKLSGVEKIAKWWFKG